MSSSTAAPVKTPRFSACIEWILAAEHPDFLERVRAAAKLGLYGVEFHFWRNKPLDALKRVLGETGLALTSFIVEPRVCLTAADQRRADFLQALGDTLVAARQVGAQAIVVASGPGDGSNDRTRQHAAMVEGLKLAAPRVADSGVMLLLEPVNTLVDHPGVFLDGTVEGLDIIEEVGSPSIRLLFDIYHSCAMQEDLEAVLGLRTHLIAHVQAADFPGRHQPGSGGIAWPKVWRALVERGYTGPVGLEYRPQGDGPASLAQTRRAFGG